MRIAGRWALIPVKPGDRAKTRLSPMFDPAQRRTLQRAMLEDLLEGLARSASLSGIALYGCDAASARFAGERRIVHLSQPDDIADLNEAVADGTRRLADAGAETIAVLPGDLPLLDGRELDIVLAQVALDGRCAVIPDRWRTGTNGLVFPADHPPAFRFGPESFRRHLLAVPPAAAGPNRPAVSPSFSLDVDTPDDLEALRSQADAGRGRHTRAFIAMTLQETTACL